MSLPKKKSRRIEVNGKIYRWTVGKLQGSHPSYFANVAIEVPNGNVKTFEEVVVIGDDMNEDGNFHVPITPSQVRQLIINNNL